MTTKPHSPRSSISWSSLGTAVLTNGVVGWFADTVLAAAGNSVAVIKMAPTARPPKIFAGNLLTIMREILIFSFPVVFVEVISFTPDAFSAFEISLSKFAGAWWWPFIGAFMIGSLVNFVMASC